MTTLIKWVEDGKEYILFSEYENNIALMLYRSFFDKSPNCGKPLSSRAKGDFCLQHRHKSPKRKKAVREARQKAKKMND